jgi:hypothetical protein
VGGRPFSFIHFLAIYTAWKVNRPEVIYFHHTEEPSGEWWRLIRPLVKLNRVPPVTEIFGRPVIYPAHKADIIRLEMLWKHGGIYLDLDVISINPFDPLLGHAFVMGIEPGTGLCNAVILAQPGAPFIERWQAQYRTFEAERWNHHSVVLPGQMAKESPELIHLADKYDFFYPTHNDPVCGYLWGEQPSLKSLAVRIGKNVVKLAGMWLAGDTDRIKRAYYQTFHGLRGKEWHYRRARKSYCLHLWEGLWGEPYLKQVGPEYLKSSKTGFARLLRCILSPEEIEGIARRELDAQTRINALDQPGPVHTPLVRASG